ncbi:MAG TPA: hypothetical protein VH639_04365 [Bryobacteraceae bacterium]|jgi:hypothetical protein
MTHPEEYQDTDPRAMEVWLDLMRRTPAGEKLARSLDLSNLALKLSEAGVRLAHPSADEREVFLRAAARRLPRDLMIRVYGWDPESNGNPG